MADLAVNVAAEARSWCGTPVAHLGRTKGVGVDCLGLVALVGVAAGVLEGADFLAAYGGYYGRLPNPARLVEGLNTFLVRIADGERRSGDVGAFAWGARELPMHLAILAERKGRATLIHAHARATPPRVVEHGYAADWPARCCGWWRYPGLV
jgi:cell wall-associated NlpC family hydrolase